MYELRYPDYVNSLLEGTEGKSEEEALSNSLSRMFASMDDEQVALILAEGLGIDLEEADFEDGMVSLAVQNYMEEKESTEQPDSPAEHLDRIAAFIADEFDAYGFEWPEGLE